MFTTQARKAYAAAVTAGLAAAIVAAQSAGIDLVEALTIAGAVLAAFQATYWTNNSAIFDGALVVDEANPLKDLYSLELATPLPELKDKTSITLQVVPPAPNSQ